MSRINLLLLVAVLASGMVLIKSAYESRRLFTELDRAQAESRRLESDHQRLLAERQAQATNLRVEQVARERLRMRVINPAVTQSVDLVRPQAASGAAR
ncbi:UNVERIFIED_ORG: cell division protein FtsL [Shinella sp. XGS7]|nr:cell division protein FtsL [Shinella sp. XGS7]